MSDQYDGPDPWDEGPGAMRPPTSEELFRDGDDDFDYEAHYYANITAAAASLGRPDLEDGIAYFGVADLRGQQITPRLVEAIENFQNLEAEAAELSVGERSPELEDQRKRVEAEARSAAREAWEKQGTPGRGQGSGPSELSRGARHVDEERRTVPVTPLFDHALKARQEETAAAASSAGRVRTLLEKIHGTVPKKNDAGLNESDIRSLEQSRDRSHGHGR